MTEWIVEEHVVFVSPAGDRIAVRIVVGVPELYEEHASCPVGLDGLERLRPIHGASTLQALVLGLRLLGTRVQDYISRGWRVVYPETDDDVELDTLLGPLLRAA